MALLNLLSSSSSSFVDSLEGFSICMIMLSVRKDHFPFSFPICVAFISFFSVAYSSSIMVDRSVEGGHPCFVPDVRGKVFGLLLQEH